MNKLFIAIDLIPFSLYSMDKLPSEDKSQLINKLQALPRAEKIEIKKKIREFKTANTDVPSKEINYYRGILFMQLKQMLERNSIQHTGEITWGWIDDLREALNQ